MNVQEAVGPMIIRSTDAGCFVRVNDAFTKQMGVAAEDLKDHSLLEWIHPEDRGQLESGIQSGVPVMARHRGSKGDWVAYQWRVTVEVDQHIVLGSLHCSAGGHSSAPNTGGVNNSLDMVAETLESVARLVEQTNPGMMCSVLLLDDEGKSVKVGAAPNLPATYNAAVEGLSIGPTVGSCGTAAFWNVPVIVENIHTDPLWRNLSDHAAEAGLSACWSHPITSRSGSVLGALALYDPNPRAPTSQELGQLKVAAQMVGLAVEKALDQIALRKSEADAQLQSRLLSAVTDVVTTYVDTRDWPMAASKLVRAALDLTHSESGFLAIVHEDEVRVVSFQGFTWSTTNNREFYEEALRCFRQQGYLSFSLIDTLFGHVATSAEAVVSNNPSADSRAGQRTPSGHPEIRNFMGYPIVRQGEVVAMIGVANRHQDYEEADIQIAHSLCRAASVLLDSYRRQERETALEEKLRQASKMEALGALAGGIAHDFNNMLAVVMGNAELAMEESGSDQVTRNLREIVTASDQATELCDRMLAFAGGGVRSTQLLECNDMLQELGGLLKVALPVNAHLEFNLAREAMWVEVDQTQLRQVVMNLITNAAEALDDAEGRIMIGSRECWMSEDDLHLLQPSATLCAGEYVQFAVTDTGVGMSLETQKRVFDPFFSTKFKGHGLGLAAVQGIVQSHKGVVTLTSDIGCGTTFTVLLPRATAPVAGQPVGAAGVQGPSGQRILVVDDEAEVREVTGKMLNLAGYLVDYACDGVEAVELFHQKPSAFDCVLLDLTMPRMNGEATFRELQKIRKDVRVILSSGYSEQDTLDRFKGAGIAGVLKKPTGRKALIEKVQEALGATQR